MADEAAAPELQPAPVSFREAARYWLRLGFISFGGPAGQIAIMHRDLVEQRRWISEKRFLHALNYCMLLPGPEAQQLATYIGWLMHRTWGGIIAGGLFVLPSLLILIALSWIYLAWGQVPAVAALLYGIKPAVVAIVLHAAWRIGNRALKNAWLWAMTGAAFLAIAVFNVPFPLIVTAAGVIGYLGGRYRPRSFAPGGGHQATAVAHPPAWIDDDTALPVRARFSRSRLVRLAGAGAALWLAGIGVLCAVYGWQGLLTQIGWFFTKAALLTFGGAYAVLPYVYQGAVQFYGWLTPVQIIDGLALGETTPGPLIMVVAFVGFVAGWGQAVFGPEQLFLAGAVAASVATFFTFLPSFLFIFIGGPVVEATHGDLRFTAPLTGITAAVVGVILNLALFFAWHVMLPRGWEAGPDWVAAGIGLAAAVALFRYKTGVITLIGASAAAGLVAFLLG